jgi:hypothetical protein
MKKGSTLSLVIFLLCTASAFAQDFRLNTYASYVFDDHVSSYYSSSNYFNATVQGGLVWGGGIEAVLQQNQGFELLYLRQDTKVATSYYDRGDQSTPFDLSSNFIMFAASQYFKKPGGNIEGYFGGMLGADIISVQNTDNGYDGSSTKFAWGLKGGANIWFSHAIGLKLQAQLLSATQSVGGGVYFGTGGTGVAVGTASSMLQFGLGGGLVFKLNAK